MKMSLSNPPVDDSQGRNISSLRCRFSVWGLPYQCRLYFHPGLLRRGSAAGMFALPSWASQKRLIDSHYLLASFTLPNHEIFVDIFFLYQQRCERTEPWTCCFWTLIWVDFSRCEFLLVSFCVCLFPHKNTFCFKYKKKAMALLYDFPPRVFTVWKWAVFFREKKMGVCEYFKFRIWIEHFSY